MTATITDAEVEAALAEFYAGLPLGSFPASARDDMRAARADIVELLRRACHYDNIGPRVRSFQSGASNGLVLDAADYIETLERQLAEAQAEVERLRKLETAFMQGDLKHV
jgi:hypothetical protein